MNWRSWGHTKTLKEKLWRCTCGGDHYLSIGFDEEMEIKPWLSVAIMKYPRGFFARLGMAWELLREGEHWDADLCLDRATATEIRDTLNELIPLIEE